MAEYIEREAALQIIDYAKQLASEQIVRESGTYELLPDTGKACYDGIITALAMCKRLINEGVIAADVQTVKRGRWIEHCDDLFPLESTIECSVCGERENMDMHNDNFCPNCGAKMDGDVYNNTRNLTDEETAIYNNRLEVEAETIDEISLL